MAKNSNQWSVRKVIRVLKNNNYEFKRNAVGSHVLYSNGKNSISISYLDLNPMMIRRIIKENNLIV